MRFRKSLPALWAILAGSVVGCQDETRPVSPDESFGAKAVCNVTKSRFSPNPQHAPPNTANHDVAWLLHNNGSAITLTGETRTSSGNITGTHHSIWVIYPYTLAAGGGIDADMLFDAGAAGSGTVGMTVHANCGNIILPSYSVLIP